LIKGIAETIGLVDETTAAIATAIGEQSAATLEISRSVLQAAEGTREVSGSISGVNAAAQDSRAAATEVLTAAGELSRNGEALKVQVDTFLREVRAA